MESADTAENPFREFGCKVTIQMENKFPFSCPVCGRKTEYPVAEMTEGAVVTCPFCKLTLTLHGHMWQDVQKEIQKLEEES